MTASTTSAIGTPHPSAASEVTGLVGDPARHDVAEHREVGADVEGEAVGGPAPATSGPRWRRSCAVRSPRRPSRVLVEPDPDPGVAGQPSHRGPGEPRATRASMTTCSTRCTWRGPRCGPGPHGEQRVADQLPGPVVGDVTAPVDPDHVRPHRRRVDQHVAGIAVGTQGVDGRVLQQEEVVLGRAPAHAPAAGPRPRGRAPGPASGPSSAVGRTAGGRGRHRPTARRPSRGR